MSHLRQQCTLAKAMQRKLPLPAARPDSSIALTVPLHAAAASPTLGRWASSLGSEQDTETSGSSYRWAGSVLCGTLALRQSSRLISRGCRATAKGSRRGVQSLSSGSSRSSAAAPSGKGSVRGTTTVQATATQQAANEAAVVSTSTSDGDLNWPAAKVRQAYIDFFCEEQEHRFVPSSPVVPLSDPTLLFANAGMNQFKAIFLGQLDPTNPLYGVRRAANSQKCIRAGGKHNDLDDVGRDSYHHTFFEMLGNWSFGDYFKEEAIDWSWKLLTEVYGLEPDRLYASYFGGDEELGLEPDLEAKKLWMRYLPEEKILPFDKKDNFWEMGAVGPCGPCSEIHYDRIGGRDAAPLVNADDPDVIEIWNLVFMQFYRGDDGTLDPLPNKHIDTGMGFERLLSILQGKRSNYDTDLFAPLFASVHAEVGGETYQGKFGEDDADLRDTAYRVVVDHARTLTLAVADGAVPSSEGRGYVLRRILRRAVRYGRQMLDAPAGFFSKLVPAVVETLEPAFPELRESLDRVTAVLKEEEDAFDRTVERGMKYFNELREELEAEGTKTVPGDRVFLLYDSHGFPVDLTQQMAEEAGLEVDVEGFEKAMEDSKERSRQALREQQAAERGLKSLDLVAEQTAWLENNGIKPTDDSQKYEWSLSQTAVVQAIFTEDGFVDAAGGEGTAEGATVGVILDSTPFYAEAGGQVSDVGMIETDDGATLLEVRAVQNFGGYILHTGLLSTHGEPLRVGQQMRCAVDYSVRARVAPNHTMTHVLNWALRDVLGKEVQQRGSLVTDEQLRFDFSADSISLKELEAVESKVQEVVEKGLPVTFEEAPLATASSITGLQAVSGEAYPDPVRVVTVGESPVKNLLASPNNEEWLTQSVEFCGGTHISNTSEARAFIVLEETSVSKGVRRIVAATGAVAEAAQAEGELVLKKLEELEEAPKEAEILELTQRVDSNSMSAVLKPVCRDRLGALRKASKKAKKKKGGVDEAVLEAARGELDKALEFSQTAGASHCVIMFDAELDGNALGALLGNIGDDVAVLAMSLSNGRVNCLAVVPESLQSGGKAAGDWVKAALEPLGGRGGGKPGRAQGSAPAAGDEQLEEAKAAAEACWSS
mmetsp:Transcript_52470/g.125372  ORF Transcript_52470/g.125372 Transcript_52470/m.125372 type:complete len:1106 (-) Transcript_52470:49-3366(-)